jgi:UDP-N-acetylmuramate dehydrogenase
MLAGFRGEIRLNEPLALHTSLKVGGPADIFAVPADLEDLKWLLADLAVNRLPFLVIGGGYNLLVKNGGFRGAVISLAGFNRLERILENFVTAGAGVTNGALVRFAGKTGLGGLEFLIGIPGTVGGALSMNAGAHGEAILERLANLTTLDRGMIISRRREELEFGYRFLRLLPDEIILEAVFRLEERDRAEVAERIERFLTHRRTTQRVSYPNAGSFFKNPAGEQAWKLIEAAGLRGFRVGGAQVSEVHTNFLVNRGKATASDFLELAGLVKERVKADSGIELAEEVRIVGED